MIEWIFFVRPASFERLDARVPFVVAAQAKPPTRHPEGRIAPGEIGLTMDRFHYVPSLPPFDVADKGPEEVQYSLDLQRGDDTPSSVWPPVSLVLTDP
jgi:hypothetical protein